MTSALTYRAAVLADLTALIQLENNSFESDRLSSRQLKHWITAANGELWVACSDGKLIGYALAIMRKGTRLARLYSIAIASDHKGRGVGKALLRHLEHQVILDGKLFMRLEVACNNTPAIKMYEAMGYRIFGTYARYYDNKTDALRMQKPIRQLLSQQVWQPFPWYKQTTEFTCGPSALMMAMASLSPNFSMSQATELDIWRQATTIFMTSGHGGCHPIGLALAARARGFDAEVIVNSQKPLFMDGVRSEHKKHIVSAVDKRFNELANEQNIKITYKDPELQELADALKKGAAVVMLISTYQMIGKKVPHWVVVTHIDDDCLYIHDSDPDDETHFSAEQAMDLQHVPIAREDYLNMSAYGKTKLRTAVIIYPNAPTQEV